MKCIGSKLISYALAAVLALTAAPVWAAITSVTAIPGQANVAIGRSTTLTVTWSLFVTLGATTATCSSGTHTIASSQGVLILDVDGTITRIIPHRLSKTVNLATNSTVTLTETYTVPPDVVALVRKLGRAQLSYYRAFTDTGTDNVTACGGNNGSQNLYVTGSSAAGFSVERMALHFDDDSTVRLLARGAKLHASADVTYGGAGQVVGVWEVADPTSTLGTPVFRPLQVVRRHLGAGGQATLHSPQLPTDQLGLYVLRLRITDPGVAFDIPEIRYFVMNEGDLPKPPAPMNQTAPDDNSSIGPQTRFGWSAIDGAKVYQLELYAVPRRSVADTLPDLGGGAAADSGATKISGPPLTGMVIPADRTETVLSPVTLGHLRAGGDYVWRVLAVDADGRVVGASPLRRLRFQ